MALTCPTTDEKYHSLLAHLIMAALRNDWGRIQDAQQALLKLGTVDEHVPWIENSLKVSNILIPRHCANCGLEEERHADWKCLFQATHYVPCEALLPTKALQAIHSKRKIDAIKELRSAMTIGLKDAKDIVEAEIAKHNWG